MHVKCKQAAKTSPADNIGFVGKRARPCTRFSTEQFNLTHNASTKRVMRVLHRRCMLNMKSYGNGWLWAAAPL